MPPRQPRGKRPRGTPRTQQRAASAPPPDIALDSCPCGQTKLATASICPDCAYEQDLMTQDAYVDMLRIINDPGARRQFAGTRCHCGRPKPRYRAECGACEDRKLNSSGPPLLTMIQRSPPSQRANCPRCGRRRNPKYALCRSCGHSAGYFLHNGEINTTVQFDKCSCGRPKHPAFALCSKCYVTPQ